jgi:hypothetical protein
MGTDTKGTEKDWKNKAIERSGRIKSLNKELKRQKQRGDFWRARYYATDIDSTKIASFQPKARLFRDKKALNGTTLAGYGFNGSVIWLSIVLYKSGLSLRCVCAVLVFIRDFLGVHFKIPSYGTVRIWVQKQGLHLLLRGYDSVKRDFERWVLIIDESYSLGKSRLLVVLAVRLSVLGSGKSLSMTNVVPVVIRSRSDWKSPQVVQALEEAQLRLGGKVAYVVCDGGANLVSACKQIGLSQVPDWSHYAANLLERCYVEDPDFKAFTEKVATFKKKRKQSEFSHYSPPTLSVKMRFMNYIPILDWVTIMQDNFKDIPVLIQPELQFLMDSKVFIAHLKDLFYKTQQIGELLKTKGICPTTKEKIDQVKNNLIKKYPDNSIVARFGAGIDSYFGITMPIYEQYIKEQTLTEMAGHTFSYKAIVASSDIIESTFSKLKHRALKDPKRGFSAISLIIPLFCYKITISDVTDAMKSISMKSLLDWQNTNLTKRGYNSFRNIFTKSTQKEGNFYHPI